MAPYEALYGRKYRSPLCWTEAEEARVHELDLVQYTSEMRVQAKELCRSEAKEVEFAVDDFVFLKVSPTKGVITFGKKGKLAPRYIGPFEITNRVGAVAYQLQLPSSLSHVHPVFHISIFRKCVPDPSQVLQPDTVELNEDLTFKEQLVAIIDYQMRQLQSK
ncbi:uncharacterized protein LOC131174053 [Hevea brasiliensis]|uniref:uncharacterized protein LOC131174053 n=1 Tax=Hevea brasiliensis TaxID=3981 RepID=UPI0025F45E29|nr:uncharacterized protein LOC131174053 [Hevea brasiliensis]